MISGIVFTHLVELVCVASLLAIQSAHAKMGAFLPVLQHPRESSHFMSANCTSTLSAIHFMALYQSVQFRRRVWFFRFCVWLLAFCLPLLFGHSSTVYDFYSVVSLISSAICAAFRRVCSRTFRFKSIRQSSEFPNCADYHSSTDV